MRNTGESKTTNRIYLALSLQLRQVHIICSLGQHLRGRHRRRSQGGDGDRSVVNKHAADARPIRFCVKRQPYGFIRKLADVDYCLFPPAGCVLLAEVITYGLAVQCARATRMPPGWEEIRRAPCPYRARTRPPTRRHNRMSG